MSLQRLRQGQGRCQQQLLSLVQWHQQAIAPEAAQQSRGFADKPPAVQFAKARKGFQNSLSELRKQWAQERQEKEAAKAAAEQATRWAHIGGGRWRHAAQAALACCQLCAALRCLMAVHSDIHATLHL